MLLEKENTKIVKNLGAFNYCIQNSVAMCDMQKDSDRRLLNE